MSDQTSILLRTKLHRPFLSGGLIDRSSLYDLLDCGINQPLTLVVASAGFGKTTLVSSWLERLAAGHPGEASSFPSAWLSLDENDSDLNIFLRYFIAALRALFPDGCEETLTLLHSRSITPPEYLFATFSNEIEQLTQNFVLVLDDYHTLRGTEVHELLNGWARHWPKPLHLVLISRINPPLPITSLRAKGMVNEIRTQNLRFTPAETQIYLNQAQIVHLSPHILALLEERFEGWPAGLHLAALSLRSHVSQEAILSALSSENTNVTAYLVDEVLTHQYPAIHSFLLKTSILDRFCPSLCEAILGEMDPAWNVKACLEWIERSEMFITPLDNRREWYRYHHLFKELLEQRLVAEAGAAQEQNLHRLASAWFEEGGLIEEAIQHALAAGELDLVARQMNAGLRDVVNREDRQTLERWLRLIPEEMIQRRPWLLMIRVWALEFSWRLGLQAQVIQQTEKLLDSEVGISLPESDLRILHGQILAIKAQQAYFRNELSLAIERCQQALHLLPPTWTFPRGGAMLYLGSSLQANGQVSEAENLLLNEYNSYRDKSDTFPLMLLESLCFIYLYTNQFDRCTQIAQLLFQGATRSGMGVMKSWSHWFLGVIAFYRNELESAARHFTLIFENRYVAQIAAYRDAVAGLAIIHQIKGESAEAWQMLESISQFDLEQRGSEDNRTRSLRARLTLLKGDLEGAGDWVKNLTDPPPDAPLIWLEEPQVTRARILVARGAESDLQLAGQILDSLFDITERTHNTRYKIEILALRAITLEAQGESIQALIELKQAVDLARPGEFLRVFVDLGKPMQKMLRQLATQGHSVEAVQRILAVFPKPAHDSGLSGNPAQPRHRPIPDDSTLVEPLTARELEVLAGLRGQSGIKEIALNLNISYATVRRHTINIYGKLGVNRRWDAVAKAEELQILPPR